MANTRQTLLKIGGNLNESMGERQNDTRPQLSPVARPKDMGRKPLRKAGTINIDLVVPDPKQPREEFSDAALAKLAASIQKRGQLQPILVRWSEQAGKWMIVVGERRWRAVQKAGLPTIDCLFQEGKISPGELLAQQLVENLLREDLRPIEEARAFAGMMELHDWNGKQVAEALHVNPTRVSRALALLDLPEEIQRQVEAGIIAARSAYELSKLTDEGALRELSAKAAEGSLTATQAAKAVRKRRGKSPRKQRGTKLVFIVDDYWKATVSSPTKGTYHDVEEVLQHALREVRHRIKNNVQMF